MPDLFTPIDLRSVSIPNRVWMSPMCTYSAAAGGDAVGAPTDFHVSHYAARAAGGAGLVMVEATGVRPEGRISPWDLGLWSDAQQASFSRLVDSISTAGAVPAIQLAHAGRKASVNKPWLGNSTVPNGEGGWTPVGPSEEAFPGLATPTSLSEAEIADLVQAFAHSAARAVATGFKVIEIHAAHGYLLHSFLSPLSNLRTDRYGGDFEGRSRIVLEIVDAVRQAVPDELPVLLRISSTDWIEEDAADSRASWTVDESIRLTEAVLPRGIELVDVSSGGLTLAKIPRDRDYQTSRASRIRRESAASVAAVGRISEPEQADGLIRDGHADAVFIGRSMLRDPSWANHAAAQLEHKPRFVEQYAYAL